MISTRGRYALRVMVDLAEHRNGRFLPMKEVAARQEISLKYIEKIMPLLTAAALVEGQHGKGGGYRLTREPGDYTVGEILRVSEGDLAPVSCLLPGAEPCPREAQCRTIGLWREYYRLTNEFFDGVTLADLLESEPPLDFVI